MKHASLVKAMEKAGFTVLGEDENFKVINGDDIIKWCKQDDRVECLVRGKVSNPSDVQTDYWPYFRVDTIKEAVWRLGVKCDTTTTASNTGQL